MKVSGDGSWKKRGFKSLYGVTTLIGYYSGKVIDLTVFSSYRHACAIWKNKPKDSPEHQAWEEDYDEEACTKTHDGSAGSMEVEAIKTMFARSEQLYGVKYGNYIGDGDSKTFQGVLKLNPYGDELTVVKNECIGHVQKRMGTRLRSIKKEKKLGGRGKLTEALVKKLSLYYGLAIRRNINSVEDMKKAIIATYDHMISTDDDPKHDNCPVGADSWCKWKKAEALGTKPPVHPKPLHHDVQKAILPIYKDLSRDDLIERCLGGHTQNANESFNSTVWRLALKHLNSGLKIVEIAAYLAACLFNEGSSSILSIMNELNIVVGNRSYNFAQEVDNRRIIRQNRRSSVNSKESRKARQEKLRAENDAYEAAEGLQYGAGIAD